MRPFIVITVMIFIFFFPAMYFKTAWVLLISWGPALFVGIYLDNEMDDKNY
jgi:hypothetical protein